MGKHYIPQFLLSGFTEEGRLFVFDKVRAQWFASQPKSIANEGDLWPDETENFVTENIENPAQHAIEQLRGRHQLTAPDRHALARYIAFLWKRVPANREQFLNALPEVGERIRRDLNQTLKVEQRVIANKHIDKLIAERPAALWQASIQAGFRRDVPGAIVGMQWQVIHADEPSFFASDNPVFFFRTDGIGRSTSELTLPFSSRAALVGRYALGDRPLHVSAQSSQVKEINRRTVSKATRFVFAQTKQPWMMPFLLKVHEPARGSIFSDRGHLII